MQGTLAYCRWGRQRARNFCLPPQRYVIRVRRIARISMFTASNNPDAPAQTNRANSSQVRFWRIRPDSTRIRPDWRRRSESNRRMGLLQSPALPLGYSAVRSAGTLGKRAADAQACSFGRWRLAQGSLPGPGRVLKLTAWRSPRRGAMLVGREPKSSAGMVEPIS